MSMWNNQQKELKALATRNSTQHSSSFPFSSRQSKILSNTRTKKAA